MGDNSRIIVLLWVKARSTQEPNESGIVGNIHLPPRAQCGALVIINSSPLAGYIWLWEFVRHLRPPEWWGVSRIHQWCPISMETPIKPGCICFRDRQERPDPLPFFFLDSAGIWGESVVNGMGAFRQGPWKKNSFTSSSVVFAETFCTCLCYGYILTIFMKYKIQHIFHEHGKPIGLNCSWA